MKKQDFISICLFILLALAPNSLSLVFANPTEPVKRLVFILTLSVLLGIYLAIYFRKKLTIQFNLIDKAVVAFMGVGLLSTMFSIEPVNSLLGLWGGWSGNNSYLLLTTFFVGYYFLLKQLYVEKWINLGVVVWSLLGGGLIGSIYYFGEVISLKTVLTNPLFVLFTHPPLALPATQSHQIVFAFYLFVIVNIGLIYGLFSFKSLQGKLALVVVAFLSWVMFLTQVRGIWVLIPVQLIVVALAWFYYRRFTFHLNRNSSLLVVAFVVVIGLGISQTHIKERFSALDNQPNYSNSVSLRTAEWNGALRIFTDRPLLGYGLNTVHATYPKYKPEFVNQNEAEWQIQTADIRNHYLNILDMQGVLGLGAFILIVLSVVSSISKKRLDAQQAVFLTGFLAVLLVSTLYHQTFALALLFWTSLASFSVLVSGKTTSTLQQSGKMILLGVAVISFIGASLYLVSNYHYSRALVFASDYLQTFSQKDFQKANDSFDQALTLNPLHLKARNDKGKLQTEYLKRQVILKVSGGESQTIFTSGRSSLMGALQWAPHAIDPKRNLVELYFYSDQLRADKALLDQAISLQTEVTEADPKNPINWDFLGQLYLEKGDLDTAEKDFRQAISLKDNYIAFYSHLGEVLKQQGRLQESLDLYEYLLKSDSNPKFRQEIEILRGLLKQKTSTE